MATTFVDLVKIIATSTGTGPFSLGAPVQGFRGVDALIDGAAYSYSVQQVASYEFGRGIYNATARTLSRGVIGSSAGNTAVAFAANASVTFTLLAEDVGALGGGGGGGAGTVTSVDADGGTTGLTFAGGPITTTGTFELLGTLAVDHGGTGATTPSTAAAALLPAQAGETGKALVTDGAGNLSWQPVAGGTTGVVPGTYGDSSHVAVFTVGDDGRLTAATSVAVDGGGGGPGDPPTIVQVGHATNVGTTDTSVTMPLAPTAGNLLVAMTFNPNNIGAGTGWTLVLTDVTGTDDAALLIKTVGVGESAVQSPLIPPGGANPMATVIWELNGVSATPFLFAASQPEQNGTVNVSPLVSNAINAIALMACAVTVSNGILDGIGATQDVLDNSFNRSLFAGHSDARRSNAQLFTRLNGNANSKSTLCVITR